MGANAPVCDWSLEAVLTIVRSVTEISAGLCVRCCNLVRWLLGLGSGEGKGCVVTTPFQNLCFFGVDRTCMGTVVHPCRVKYFRKAVSTVMDDLEKCHLIIDNLHLMPC